MAINILQIYFNIHAHRHLCSGYNAKQISLSRHPLECITNRLETAPCKNVTGLMSDFMSTANYISLPFLRVYRHL